MNILKNQSKKLIIFEILCLVLIIGMIGYTYSFFNVTATSTGVISGEAASLNINLQVEKVSPSSNKALIPQLDEYITSAVIGRKGSCIDDNNNSVCQVYKITVENASASTATLNGTLELNVGNNSNLKWAQISGTSEPTLIGDVNLNTTTTLVSNVMFNANETKIYYIVLWISETGLAQTDSGNFSGTVIFSNVEEGSGSEGSGGTTTGSSSSTLTLLNLTSNGTKSSFASVATTDEGVFEAQDDLGTSYYFRGAVTNNYVKFAGFYWRIIRINGDGSIRMIYDGTEAHKNGDSSTDRYMTTKAYNLSYSDNAYVGYMYGEIGATEYNETHANTNSSTIKIYLDSWYKTNIVDAGYSSYVADAIYCNDREVNSGTGIGTTVTYYKGYSRNANSSPIPTLECSQANDKFTVSSDLGNGALEYPIGLITADEVVMAGGVYNTENSSYYLYMGSWFWTMSPYFFSGSRANSFYVIGANLLYNDVFYGDGCRGVISLSSSAIQYGDGSKDNPWRLTSAI